MAAELSILKLFFSSTVMLFVGRLEHGWATESGNTKKNAYSRGFGDHINWMSLPDALSLSSLENKYIVVLIHKSWCGACKALKSEFAESKGIEELSRDFVMVNLEDDEEPSDDMFFPDGGYVPRLLFVGPDGKVKPELFNELGNPSYKYFYSEAEDVISAMKKVLQLNEQQKKISKDEL